MIRGLLGKKSCIGVKQTMQTVFLDLQGILDCKHRADALIVTSKTSTSNGNQSKTFVVK